MSSESLARSAKLLNEQVAAGLRGDFKRGWEIAEELHQLTPHCNRSRFNRGWYEMMHGDLLSGLVSLDSGRWEKVFGSPPLSTSKPIYRNEDLNGRHVLLRLEGGLGDEIINARFARNFHTLGAKVTVSCDAGLASVFSRMPEVAAVVHQPAAASVYHDFWVPGMSAARVLETTYEKLDGTPYLIPHSGYIEKWKRYFAENFSENNRPRIGLRFYGNPQFEHQQHRKFPHQGLIDSLAGRSFVSLQKEDTPLPIQNWEDTIAVIMQLDLVITSCTSVAHMSAALGKETWVITPILPYYIWSRPGIKSSWYNSVTLFRQKKFQNWQTVFNEIAAALKLRFP